MTAEKLRAELRQFRELMQSRDVMLDLERRDALGRGLAWAWMQCSEPDENLATLVEASLQEFHHRCMLIDIHCVVTEAEKS